MKRALFLLMALALACPWLAPGEVLGAGVPQAVWEDNARTHRRSPSQVPTQLRVPQVRAGRVPLPENAQDARAKSARARIASGEAPLAAAPQGGTLPMLGQEDWRLKVHPAAVTAGPNVLLGDIAAPLGEIDPALWEKLRLTELWPAPPEEGKPLQISRSRLSVALREALGAETAGRMALPSSLVIQRGGALFREDDLRSYVIRSLAPQLAAMPGEAELDDFRLPDYIFLAHSRQQVQLEPGKLSPGRVSLRFSVQDADGKELRKVAGTANLRLWVTVPATSRAVNKGDPLTPDAVTFMRVSAGQLKDVPWDGQGGPWQALRSLAPGEPILQSDLASQLMVRRGNILTLRYERGNVRLVTQGEALADGQPGATIPVRNLQTKKQVYATVKDGSTAVIH